MVPTAAPKAVPGIYDFHNGIIASDRVGVGVYVPFQGLGFSRRWTCRIAIFSAEVFGRHGMGLGTDAAAQSRPGLHLAIPTVQFNAPVEPASARPPCSPAHTRGDLVFGSENCVF